MGTQRLFVGSLQTQHMHDVIGDDGTVPGALRALAREQISVYGSVSMTNGTVASIIPEGNGSYFTTTDTSGQQYLSKKIILATGMKDLLPNTPGLATAFGRSKYCLFYFLDASTASANKQQGAPGLTAGNIKTPHLQIWAPSMPNSSKQPSQQRPSTPNP